MNFNPNRLEDCKYDVVIIGAGLAGLYTAIKLIPLKVLVITDGYVSEASSSLKAQGGIAASVGDSDSAERHAEDTISAGAGLVDSEIAHILAHEAVDQVDELIKLGVRFDVSDGGAYKLGLEGAHSQNRIVKIEGDRAGAVIMENLIAALSDYPSITLIENHQLLQICKDKNVRVSSILIASSLKDDKKTIKKIKCKNLVLATGGLGAIYKDTTNPQYINGSGMAIAALAGVKIKDAEFVQFHPTAFDIDTDPCPLATEALRGAGAKLVNFKGKRFLLETHEKAELAPRDIVTREVFKQMKGGDKVFLDCRDAIGDRMSKQFPTVYNICCENGIDPGNNMIAIKPAAHFHMGGIMVDKYGKTSLNGLWACGEVACNGLHGANRLASNSLIEALVFGARVAKNIKGEKDVALTGLNEENIDENNSDHLWLADDYDYKAHDIKNQKLLRNIMMEKVGIIRNDEGLMEAKRNLLSIIDETKSFKIVLMVISALFIVKAAQRRKHSCGAHFRDDFPDIDESKKLKDRIMDINDLADDIKF